MQVAERSFSLRPFAMRGDAWTVGVMLLALLLSLPVLVVLGYLFEPSGEVWRHLVETVLHVITSYSIHYTKLYEKHRKTEFS